MTHQASRDTGYRTVPMYLRNVEDQTLDLLNSLAACPTFKQTAKFHVPFDLGLNPFEVYRPRWLTSSQHVNPCEAVKIFDEPGCERGPRSVGALGP